MSQSVSYLRPTTGLGHAVIEIIDALRQHLKQPEHDQRYIHRIRVDIKRLRAWLRMIRYRSGDNHWKMTDRSLRAIADELSSRRDTQVMMETLKWLAEKSKTENEKHAAGIIHARIQFDLGHYPVDWKTVKVSLAGELDTLRQQAYLPVCDRVIMKGLKKTYKRSLEYGNKAFSENGSIDDLHKLRKWVKYLYYQFGHIHATYPDQYGNERKHLKKLGDRLGIIHDLNLLDKKLDDLSSQPDSLDAIKVIRKMMKRRQNKLTKQSECLYKKVFTQSPSSFVETISRAVF